MYRLDIKILTNDEKEMILSKEQIKARDVPPRIRPFEDAYARLQPLFAHLQIVKTPLLLQTPHRLCVVWRYAFGSEPITVLDTQERESVLYMNDEPGTLVYLSEAEYEQSQIVYDRIILNPPPWLGSIKK